jgi:hypothetical protein
LAEGIVTDPRVRIGLELNRLFYEGRGDEFIDMFTDHVGRQGIVVSEEAVIRLLAMVRTIRPKNLKTRRFEG